MLSSNLVVGDKDWIIVEDEVKLMVRNCKNFTLASFLCYFLLAWSYTLMNLSDSYGTRNKQNPFRPPHKTLKCWQHLDSNLLKKKKKSFLSKIINNFIDIKKINKITNLTSSLLKLLPDYLLRVFLIKWKISIFDPGVDPRLGTSGVGYMPGFCWLPHYAICIIIQASQYHMFRDTSESIMCRP